MRILFLNPVGALGGAERVLLEIFEPLLRSEPGIALGLLTGTDGPLLSRAALLGVRTEVVTMPTALTNFGEHGVDWKDPRAAFRAVDTALRGGGAVGLYARRLARAIRRFDPTLVHSNGIKTHILSALVAPRGIPLLWHLHDFIGDRPLASSALRMAARFATGAIANSHAVAIDARRVLGPRLPIEVIHNAVDTSHYSPGSVDARLLDRLAGAIPSAAGTIRIGLVATYARWKGHGLFLEAAARVLARGSADPVRFYIIGGPIYRTAGSQFSEAELRGEADRLGIAQDVVFVPFQEDLRDVYRSLDVVVHASTRREPFGMVIVEAMSTGRAVVVADAGGASELFEHGEDALGYEAGNAQALAEAITALVASRDLRERLGDGGRRSAIARFSRERLGGQLVTIYHGVVRKLASGARS